MYCIKIKAISSEFRFKSLFKAPLRGMTGLSGLILKRRQACGLSWSPGQGFLSTRILSDHYHRYIDQTCHVGVLRNNGPKKWLERSPVIYFQGSTFVGLSDLMNIILIISFWSQYFGLRSSFVWLNVVLMYVKFILSCLCNGGSTVMWGWWAFAECLYICILLMVFF